MELDRPQGDRLRRRSARGVGPRPLEELPGRHPGDVLLVHPEQLLGVEDRGRGADALERELPLHLLAREDLAVASGRPAEKRQEVEEGLGEDALVAPLLDGGRAVPLGELLAVRAEDHPQVGELRNGSAERPEQGDVLGRVGEVIVAADDVADPHLGVVHADAEVVERVAVRAHEHEVVQRVGGKLDAAADQVLDDDRFGRHPEPNDVALARPRPPVALLGSDAAPGPRVAVGPARGVGRLALGVELLGRLEGPVGLALADQPVRGVPIEVVPAGLVERTLVVAEPEPLHGREDLRGQLLARALDVGVLDAQDERAALVPREEQVVERGARAPDVERARRGRRKPDAGLHRLIQGARS